VSLFAQGFPARFWSLIAATFLGFIGIGAVLPGLAPHIRHDLGGSDQTVGLVIGTFSFVALASRFFSGPLADRRGRRIAILAGLVSSALSGVAYLLPMGLVGPYLARALQGFGEACLYTGAAAWAVEIAGLDRGAQALGYLSSGIWGGISAGPVVGQWLGSFQRAAVMQSICALAAFAIVSQIPEDYRPGRRRVRTHWIHPSIIAPGFAIGLVNVHFPVIAGFLILHLARHGNSGPAAFSTYAGVILLSRFFLGGLPDRIPPAITFYGGVAAMAVGLLVLAGGPPPALAIAAAGLLGLGFSFPWSSVITGVLRQTPEDERGYTVGVLTAFYDLFVGLSSFAAGGIADRFGYPAAFLMAAGALAGAVAAGLYVFRRQNAPQSVETREAVVQER
jgi:MFS family permease